MRWPRRGRRSTFPMGSPTVTADDLRAALAAFHREARLGTLDTGRYRMRYSVWGSGPPLVIVHGMADAGRGFVMVMHRLAGRFTCVAHELPHGLGDGAAVGRYTHREYAADLLALMDHLGFAKAAVLGSSFGSTVAVAALAAAPHRFSRGILQGAFARRPLARGQFRLAQVARFWPGWFGDWPGIHEPVMARVEREVYQGVPPEVWRFFVATSARTPVRAAALRALTIGRTDLRPLLPSIRVPVLMIGGDRDPLVPRWCERELEEGLPDVRRVELSPCGHYPQYTHPGPMADAILRFLGPGERGA